MASTTTLSASRLAAVAPLARDLARDEQFRRHATHALATADRLRSELRGDDRRAIAQRLLDDTTVQHDVGVLVQDVQAAVDRARKRGRRRARSRLLLLVGVGAIVAPLLVTYLRRRRSTAPAEPDDLAGSIA